MATIRQTVLILLLGCAAGLAFNQLSPGGISLGNHNPFPDVQKTATLESMPTVDLAMAKTLFDQGMAIFVDARPVELFSQGRIPGAFNIPDKQFNAYYPEFQSVIPPDEKVIVYCDGKECLASLEIANQLREKGYTDVLVFFGGWQQWLEAAYPIEWD